MTSLLLQFGKSKTMELAKHFFNPFNFFSKFEFSLYFLHYDVEHLLNKYQVELKQYQVLMIYLFLA